MRAHVGMLNASLIGLLIACLTPGSGSAAGARQESGASTPAKAGATTVPQASTSRAVAAPAARPRDARKTARKRSSIAAATTDSTASPSARPRAAARRGTATRTLEDIHIEGELPAPQVLFITTRDQRRVVGFQHHRYLKTSQQLGETAVMPSEIVVIRAATPPERSHSDE